MPNKHIRLDTRICDKFVVRFTIEGLRDRIKELAKDNSQSMNAYIEDLLLADVNKAEAKLGGFNTPIQIGNQTFIGINVGKSKPMMAEVTMDGVMVVLTPIREEDQLVTPTISLPLQEYVEMLNVL